jgi:tetratricopeptide (TPR) repeat protein
MRYAALTLLLLAAACATAPKQDSPPAPAAPQITEDTLRTRANEQLAQGQRQYEAGEFDAAFKSLSSALDHGMLAKSEQARARKYLAFIHCLAGREVLCRDEFRKAFEIQSDFSLAPAEDGHPIWGPVYRNVRTQLIAERDATETRKGAFKPTARSEQILQEGMIKYDSGDYVTAVKLLESALKEGLTDKALQVRAMKHIAFSLCLQEKYRDCRAAFVKIYDVDSDFDLTPAEAGHPSWTKTFAAAKAQAKKAIADKAAQEASAKTAKEKAASPPPGAASVPKKN